MTSSRALRHAYSAALLATLCTGCLATSRPHVLTLEPYAGTSLRTVNATIGETTTTLIFDTGGGITLVTPRLAVASHCTPFGRINGQRADGTRVSAQRCDSLSLGLGDIIRRVNTAVFNLDSLLGPAAPPVGGLLALNAFRGQAVTLDWRRDRVIVETPGSLGRRIRDMREVNIRLAEGAGGDVDLFLEVRARSGTVWLQVDSGNNGPVFLAPHAAAQLGIDLPQGGSLAGTLDVVGMGIVPARLALREMIYDGQVGPEFLRHLVLTIDLGSRRGWATLARDAEGSSSPDTVASGFSPG